MFALRSFPGSADYNVRVLHDRRARWFVWARQRLRLALADHGGGRPLGERYLAFEQTLSMRSLRMDGTPVQVKIKHRDDFLLPSDLAASEREEEEA